MLTPAWTQLRYHEQQAQLWRDPARFIAVRAGRGSGKTELARRRIVRMLPIEKPWSDPIYFYALPTFAQARRVAWRPIKKLIPPEWIKGNPSESELRIDTVFGATLYVIGMDKPQRYEGVQWDGGIIDESSDQRPDAFKLSFLPALAHRNGWGWRIGVPKRVGIGARAFRQAFEEWSNNDDPMTNAYTWASDTVLGADEIAWARNHLVERDFNEQYAGIDEDFGGLIFYAFTKYNTVQDIDYDPTAPLLIGSDFNVNPMCWVIAQREGDTLYVIDELHLRNTNTRRTLDELFLRYPAHMGGWEFYGDAAGKARHTSADRSDYIQIKNDTRFNNSKVFYPSSNPRLQARFAACNRLFCSAGGVRRCFIHQRCRRLIADLEQRVYKDGTNEPHDYGDIGHITDALGYIIHRLWPVRLDAPAGASAVHIMQGM